MYSKEELKEMDKDIKVKKFLKLIYKGFDEETEYIKIFQTTKENFNEKYFNDIDAVVNYVTSKVKYNKNTYFELSTNNGSSGKSEDLLYRYCLGFDFDKKELGEDFDHIDILNLFKQNKLHYHCLIDSGNGYHAYICINKTNDFEKIEKIQAILSKKLGADMNACKTTQLLRVPYTYNIKDENKTKLVKIIAMDDRNKIKPYDINYLYDKNCTINNLNNLEKSKQYVINNTNIPICIQNIINNGTSEGDRYNDLQKIIISLRQRNKSLNDIITVCKSWAKKSNFNDNLEYRIKNIYKNLNYVKMECKECEYKKDCFNFLESEFDFDKLVDENGVIYSTYNLEDKITRKIRNKQNRSDKMLNGNEILILNILRNEYENPRPLCKEFEYGQDIKMLLQSITHKKKRCMSETTLRNTLKSLLEKGFILEGTGKRKSKYYHFNPIRTSIEKTIRVSMMCIAMCVCQNITTDELGLYILMRYLHKKQLQENKTKGNCFTMTQSDLAKAYYGNNATDNQTNISKMIHNLIDCHVLDIWDKNSSRNNGFDYYRYRLNS